MSDGIAVNDTGVVVGDDGVHVDDTTANCCCEGYCPCPIDPWPPAGWPVTTGGHTFNQSYAVTAYHQDVYFSNDGGATLKLAFTLDFVDSISDMVADTDACTWKGGSIHLSRQNYNLSSGTTCGAPTTDTYAVSIRRGLNGSGLCAWIETLDDGSQTNPIPDGANYVWSGITDPYTNSGECDWTPDYNYRSYNGTMTIA